MLGGKLRRLASATDGFDERRGEKRKRDQASDVAVGHSVISGNFEGVLRAAGSKLAEPASPACNCADEGDVKLCCRSRFASQDDPLLNAAASKLYWHAALDQ